MNLGLDLGSRTGWATIEGGKITDRGFVDLVVGSDSAKRSTSIRKMAKAAGHSNRDYDPRPAALESFLKRFRGVERVIFEDVQFVQSLAQGQLWASLRGAMWLSLPESRFQAVQVGTLKKFATGKGNSDKEIMAQALQMKTGILETDDNAVDACWLCFFGENT